MAGQGSFEIGKVLSRASSAIGGNLGLYLLLALPLAGFPTFLNSWRASQYLSGLTPQEIFAELFSSGLWIAMAPALLISWVTRPALQAALTRATVTSLSGRSPAATDVLETGFAKLLPVFLINLVMSIGVWLGCLLLIVPGVILWLCWSLAVPAYVEERLGPIEALSRSVELTRDYRGALFLLMIIVAIGLFFAGWVIGLIVRIIAGGSIMANAISQGLSSAVGAMVVIAVLATAYVELRRIKEGGASSELETVFN